jgi:hypothetical protein
MMRGRVLVKAIWGAATNRVSLFFSAATAVGALLFQSGALCGVAVGGYVLAMAVDLGRTTRWREAIREVKREPPALPSSLSFGCPLARNLMGRIERARAERLEALGARSSDGFAGLDTLAETAGDLERAAGDQLVLLDRLARLLTADVLDPVHGEMSRLERAAASAAPAAGADYDRAMTALSDRVRSLEQAEASRALLLAKLEGIVGGLESLPTRLVALDLQQSTHALLDRGPPVDELLVELQALEQAARVNPHRPGDPEKDNWFWPPGLGAVAG